ncbi:beta-galactosidase [Streptomyces antnestii]|uniref:Beta-galactosidase n=1 Tax=Streptomyces antnestii TaxID=2494256 RepID=A0A437PNP7_9ACTN|nr:discoidin domain-containing protein [Streptomyces sp. San01]RVU23769.1 beta-galactosidase [Streptomyces sp. San01]
MSNTMDGVRRRGVLAAGLAGAGAALVPVGRAAATPGAGTTAASDGAGKGARRVLNFNTGWAFWREDAAGAQHPGFDDAQWAAVSLPHTMRLERKHPSVYDAFAGIGWYRRYFRVDPQDESRRLTVVFDGVQTDCVVYLNGEKLAEHQGGYKGFVVDITGKVRFDGDNVLAVRVSNLDDPLTPPGKPRTQLGFLTFGGIYRGVTLRVTDPVHISDPLQEDLVAGGGVFVSYPKATTLRATAQVKTHVVNETADGARIRLATTLYDAQGTVVARATDQATVSGKDGHTFTGVLSVARPHLWHPDSPYLYRLVSEVYMGDRLVDTVTTRTGVRRIDFKADGFHLNGEQLYLRGANCHQNYAYIGDAAPASLKYREALRLKLGGFNAVRTAHYPHDPAFLDACDELGLLVVACEPGWQYWNGDQTFVSRTYRDIATMIRRDRNRPSVILWETSLNETRYPQWWAKEADSVAHAEMPGDQMFTSADYGIWGSAYDVNYKVVNTDGSDPAPNVPFLTREWGDWEDPSRTDRSAGESAMVDQVVTRQRYLNGDGYWDWGGLDANGRIGGYFLWVFEDYGTNDTYQKSGAVDIDRYPKYCYYWLKSMQPATNLNQGGPMVFIASAHTADSAQTVRVFSNTDRVRLYQKGHLVDEQTRSGNAASAPNVAAKGGSPYYTFSLPEFAAGELRAEGYLGDVLAATHSVNTPGAAHHLEVAADDAGGRDALVDLLALALGDSSQDGKKAARKLLAEVQPGQVDQLVDLAGKKRGRAVSAKEAVGLRTVSGMLDRIRPVADGSDLIPVYVKVVDADGNLVPDSSATLDIKVTGSGTLVGADIPRIAVQTQKAQGGIGYALIATGTAGGSLTLTATSTGLADGEYTVRTEPYRGTHVTDGTHPTWKNISTLESQGAQNLALFKEATASTTQSGHEPGDAVDDAAESKWVGDGSDPAWWQVDLGESVALEQFQILWETDETAYQYRILTSDDGGTWKTTVDAHDNTAAVTTAVHQVKVTTRYVRVDILDAGDWWPSIREFRAVPPGGSGGVPPADPGPKIARDQIKTVTASSAATGFEADKAFDGDITFGTGWSAASPAVPQTLTAELAAAHDLAGVRIHWGKDSSWYTFDLQTSTDGSTWDTALSGLTRSGQYTLPELFKASNVRQVRISVIQVSGGGAQSVAGIAEVILYGEPA